MFNLKKDEGLLKKFKLKYNWRGKHGLCDICFNSGLVSYNHSRFEDGICSSCAFLQLKEEEEKKEEERKIVNKLLYNQDFFAWIHQFYQTQRSNDSYDEEFNLWIASKWKKEKARWRKEEENKAVELRKEREREQEQELKEEQEELLNKQVCLNCIYCVKEDEAVDWYTVCHLFPPEQRSDKSRIENSLTEFCKEFKKKDVKDVVKP